MAAIIYLLNLIWNWPFNQYLNSSKAKTYKLKIHNKHIHMQKQQQGHCWTYYKVYLSIAGTFPSSLDLSIAGTFPSSLDCLLYPGVTLCIMRFIQFFSDEIPVRGFIGHLEEGGFLPHHHKIFLWAHLNFNIEYNGDQVIRVPEKYRLSIY